MGNLAAAAPALEPESLPPPPAPSAPADPPGLTSGQRDFLAGLTIDQRSRFDEWSEGRRAQTLAGFSNGLDKIILVDTLRALAPPKAPDLPPPTAPLPELIAALTKPRGFMLAAVCAKALMLALDDRGGTKSYAVMYNLCGQVVNGARDPESLIEPLVKSIERKMAGEPIKNLAGYFIRGVQNWNRENSGPAP